MPRDQESIDQMMKYQNRQPNINVQPTDELMIELSTDCYCSGPSYSIEKPKKPRNNMIKHFNSNESSSRNPTKVLFQEEESQIIL